MREAKVSPRKGEAIDLLVLDLLALGYPAPEFEHRFHETRRWRFDVAFPRLALAIEIDGGTWTGGRHVSGAGYQRDAQKLNAAAVLGWKVLRFTPRMIADGEAAATLHALGLGGKEA